MRYNNNRIVYEVGDWIIFKPAFSEEQIKQINNIVIYTVDDTKNYPAGHGQRFYCDDIEVFSTNSMLYFNVRLATQKEIDKAIETQNPKFKIGDWVTRITPWANPFDGKITYPIREIKDGHIWPDWPACQTANSPSSQFRLATPEEIKQAQRIKFKVGDWITVIEKPNSQNEKWLGYTDRITKIEDDTITTSGLSEYPAGLFFVRNFKFRLATKDEIEKTQRSDIKVGEYTAKYTNDKVYFGCKSYSRAFVNRMLDDMLQYDMSLVIINGFSISRDLVKKIYNGF